MKKEEEKILVAAVVSGDQAAQGRLYEAFVQRIHVVACAILGYQDADVEDVVQETFIAAMRDLKNFEFRSSLYTWLNHVCVNLCYRRLSKRRKVLSGLDDSFDLMLGSKAFEQDQEEQAQAAVKERLGKMWEAVDGLKKACREILQMRHKEGLAYAGIGKALKVPMGTVMSRLARCREELKRRMERLEKTEQHV